MQKQNIVYLFCQLVYKAPAHPPLSRNQNIASNTSKLPTHQTSSALQDKLKLQHPYKKVHKSTDLSSNRPTQLKMFQLIFLFVALALAADTSAQSAQGVKPWVMWVMVLAIIGTIALLATAGVLFVKYQRRRDAKKEHRNWPIALQEV